MNRRQSNSGFSLIELVLGMALSGLFMLAIASVLTSVTKMQTSVNDQASVDTTYLLGIQNARSVFQTSKLADYASQPELKNCLSGKSTVDCTTFGTKKDFTSADADTNASLNGFFSSRGRCPALGPECKVEIKTTSQWLCTTTVCTGVRMIVTATPYEADGSPSKTLKPRQGSFSLTNQTFNSKASVSFQCAGAGNAHLIGIDYTQYRDICSTIDGGAACTMPARLFASASAATNCQPDQLTSCAGLYGYTQLGLYAAQSSCLPNYPGPSYGGWSLNGVSYAAPAVPPTPPAQHLPGDIIYVPSPPSPPPAVPPPPGDGGGGN